MKETGSIMYVYKDFPQREIWEGMCRIAAEAGTDKKKQRWMEQLIPGLVEVAEKYGLEGNLFHAYLAYLLANNENPYSMACEMKGQIKGSLQALALHDFAIFLQLFRAFPGEGGSPEVLYTYKPVRQGQYYPPEVSREISRLGGQLAEAEDEQAFCRRIVRFYKSFGVGNLGMFKAFRLEEGAGKEGRGVTIRPITNYSYMTFDKLIGYDSQKDKLRANTEAFLQKKPANNVLLYGESGTGKSSSIKATLNTYFPRGLRMIEVYKHQFCWLPDLLAQLKERQYRFILYLDDLSFEEFEIEYKYLKAVIEGGLEKKPDNVLVYATSNRRHLVRESYKDNEEIRQDDLHVGDTAEEKLSLSARFGLSIFYGAPNKTEFQTIVSELARMHHLDISEEELMSQANRWELTHGGFSGRAARQLILYLEGKQ